MKTLGKKCEMQKNIYTPTNCYLYLLLQITQR